MSGVVGPNTPFSDSVISSFIMYCVVEVPVSSPYVELYGQCGGIGYTGPTVCASPWVCTVSNPYFSFCL